MQRTHFAHAERRRSSAAAGSAAAIVCIMELAHFRHDVCHFEAPSQQFLDLEGPPAVVELDHVLRAVVRVGGEVRCTMLCNRDVL